MEHLNHIHTLVDVLEESNAKYADRPAFGFVHHHPESYAQFYQLVKTMSSVLNEHGIVSGDRIVILGENQPHWGVSYFAITTMGAIAVPVLPEFHDAAVHHIIRHSGAKGIVVSKKLFPKIESMNLKDMNIMIFMDDLQVIPPSTDSDLLMEIIRKGKVEFALIKDAALKASGFRSKTVKPDDLAVILYTSGTTGHSKGVMLSHQNIVMNARLTAQRIPVSSEDRMLSVLPLAHTYECTLGLVLPVMTGISVRYIDKPPTASVLLPALQKIRPTIMLTVPLIIEKIFKLQVLPKFNKNAIVKGLYGISFIRHKLHQIAGKRLIETFGGELKLFCIGGAAVSAEVEQFMIDARFPYSVGYGMTETSPLIAGSPTGDSKFRSTGKPLDEVKVKIDDPNPETGEGEILVKGPIVMKGYYKDPEKTNETFTNDGWLKTGDLGILDKQGFLYIKGRSKNMILGPSGENIYPEEIESVLNDHEEVLESLVYELEGKITARVFLNSEYLDATYNLANMSDTQAFKKVAEILKNLQLSVNQKVASFSRLQHISEQTEPFEKTPTQKIKRFLYTEN